MNPEPLLRLSQIIGRKAGPRSPALPAIIPVKRTSWWAGVKSGKYPQPVRLGAGCVAWRASDIAALAVNVTPKDGAK